MVWNPPSSGVGGDLGTSLVGGESRAPQLSRTPGGGDLEPPHPAAGSPEPPSGAGGGLQPLGVIQNPEVI